MVEASTVVGAPPPRPLTVGEPSFLFSLLATGSRGQEAIVTTESFVCDPWAQTETAPQEIDFSELAQLYSRV